MLCVTERWFNKNEILRRFAPQNDRIWRTPQIMVDGVLGVNELSRMLGLHKSTVSRLLSTLEQGGLVEQNLETGKFRPGVGLICLAGLVVTYKDVKMAAGPYLRQLAEVSRETVNLAIVDGEQVVNIEQVASPHIVKDLGWVGRRTPPDKRQSG